MVAIDWIILGAYLSAMILLSVGLSRRQEAADDYYLGGRKLGFFAVGVSILATQSSAISFISIPAFVATRPDGGLRFLQYELAVPAAMAALALLVVPTLRRSRAVTIYALLESRFDVRVRKAVAMLFLLGRGLATGVALYATGIVLSACLQTPLWFNLLLVGALTTVYDLFGGMTAVVYSDVVQMGVLLVALGVCIAAVTGDLGGLEGVLANFPPERLNAMQYGGGSEGLASYVIGGFFLYASYYGCDQSQAQRLLSTPTVADSQRALLLNGLLRFPLIAAYCALGVAAHAALAADPALRAAVEGGPADGLVPALLRSALPDGVRGLVFAGLLAAAMSSLDSALNALSASTAQDFLPPVDDHRAQLRRARWLTLMWGVLITAFAFVVGDISKTVIEAINKVGSAVYGPILAVFLLAVARRRPASNAVLLGLGAGFFANVSLWLFAPQVHFLWWNPIGTAVTLMVALLAPRTSTAPAAATSNTAPQDALSPATVLTAMGLCSLAIVLSMTWLS